MSSLGIEHATGTRLPEFYFLSPSLFACCSLLSYVFFFISEFSQVNMTGEMPTAYRQKLARPTIMFRTLSGGLSVLPVL